MSDNRVAIADMVDALNEGDADRFVGRYADDVTVTFMGSGKMVSGADGIRTWITSAFTMIDDFANDHIGIYGDGDTIVLEVFARGILNQDGFGKSVGESLNHHELYVYAMSGGKINEVRRY